MFPYAGPLRPETPYEVPRFSDPEEPAGPKEPAGGPAGSSGRSFETGSSGPEKHDTS